MPKAPEPFSTCQKTTKSLPRISPKSYCYNAVPNRFLAHFSTSRTNGPRSLSRAKAGTHSPSPTGSHTAAYTAKQGRFRWGRYYYPRTVSHVSETLRGQGVERQTLPLLGLGRVCSRRTQKAFGAAMRLCASLLRGVAAPLGCVIFLFLTKLRFSHPVLRAFRVCETWEVSLPSERSTRFGNPAWPGGRTANFAALRVWSRVLPKNAESLRDSDALMRVAVPRRRGPAGLRDLFATW